MKKTLRSLLAYFLAAMLLVQSVPLAFAEGVTPSVTVEDTACTAGSSVTVVVTGKNFENLGALPLELYYDADVLTLHDVYIGEAFQTQFSVINTNTPGEARINLAYEEGIAAENNTLAYLNFTVAENAPAGKTNIIVAVGDALDGDLNALSVSATSGTVTINEQEPYVPTFWLYAYTDGASFSKGETVTLQVNNSSYYGLSGGSFRVSFDDSLFRVKNATFDSSLLQGESVSDVNDTVPGQVTLSYVSDTPTWNWPLLSVELEVIGDVDTTTSLTYAVIEAYDENLAAYQTSSDCTEVSLVKLPETVDYPNLSVTSTEFAVGEQATSTLLLEKSDVAAGDFSLHFDSEILEVISVENIAAATDSKAYVVVDETDWNNGVINFSYINAAGTVQDLPLLMVTWNVLSAKSDSVLTLSGTGVKDIDINDVILEYVGETASVYAPMTISYNANGGSGTMPNQTARSGTELTLNANAFTREDHFFVGWNTKADGTGTAYDDKESITVESSVTLYAQWQAYEARWGLATGTNSDREPDSWTYGTLVDAVAYANSFYTTVYIQLLSDVTPSAPLELAAGKSAVLDLNGCDIDRKLTAPIRNGKVLTVGGNLILCDTSSTELEGQGTITGGYDQYNGGGVYVSSGTLIMNGGSISGNNAGSGAGVYLLNADFTMNGGTISGNNSSYSGGGILANNSTVILNRGVISQNTAADNGGGVHVYEATFTMNGGTISGNATKYNGGGVCVTNYSTFTMNDGTISGNITTSPDKDGVGVGVGGGVCVTGSSTFTLKDGEIFGNRAYDGGGVHAERSTFNLNGGSIYGNCAAHNGGGVYFRSNTITISGAPAVSGNVKQGTLNSETGLYEQGENGIVNNVHLHIQNTITVVGELTDGALIGVTPGFVPADTPSATVAVGGDYTITADDAAKFFGDDGTFGALDSANNAVQLIIPEAQWGEATGEDKTGKPVAWSGGTMAQAMAYANSLKSGTAYIQLLSDVKTEEPLEFSSGKTTILDLNGFDIDRGLTAATANGNVITVKGNLTICDTSTTEVENQGKITGGYNDGSGGSVYVSSSGVFTLNSGSISGNTASCGGGVYSKGTFTMSGGVISENTTTNDGGGVYVDYSGTFTLNGGTISGNTADYFGGGVYVDYGTFAMNDGAISGNTADYYGGGVYLDSNGTFTMNNGMISGNTATEQGGGVYADSKSIFAMNDGAISGNTADYYGGGVCVSGGTFAVSGGSIFGNAVIYYGGGVCVGNGTMQISGSPIISGNVKNGILNSTTGFYELGESGSTNNVYLKGVEENITVVGVLDDGACVGVDSTVVPTMGNPVTFAQGGGAPAYIITASDATKFTSDNGYLIELDSTSNALQLMEKKDPVVTLKTTSVSLNLFEDTMLTIPVECNYDFVGARFENPAVSEIFDISLGENGTIQITPKDKPEDMTWAEWGKKAGTYESAIEIEYIRGQYVTSETLTIKLTATAPKVTATAVKFNSFYAGNTQSLGFKTTNGEVTCVTVDESKTTATVPACPVWLTLNEDGTVTLINEKLTNNKGSGKLNLEVWLEGWRAPAQVAVSVSAAYTAPKLKLSASSVNIMSSSQYQEPVALTLLSGDKTPFEAIGVTDLRVADMAELSEKDQKTYAASAYAYVAEYSEATGAFTLMTNGKPINGKVLLFATIEGAAAEVSVPLTVKVVMPTLKVNPTKVTLNTAKGYAVGERDEMSVTFSGDVPASWYNDVSYEVTPPKGEDATKLMMENNGDGMVTFYGNEGIADGSYKVNVTVGAAKPVAITVTAKATLPKLKLDKSSITLNTAMGDYADVQFVTVTDSDANYDFVLKPDEITVPSGLSAVVDANNVISVSTAATTAPGSYKVEIDHKMPGGQSVKSTLTVKVVNKLPTVKLGSSSVSLHSEVGIAEIPVSGLIGYENCSLVPVVSNFVSVTGDSEKLTVTLTENAEVGKTYKVNVEYNVGNEKTKAVALSVKAVSAITATASIKGNMDVTRPETTSSNFTFKYTGWYPGAYGADGPDLHWMVEALNGKISLGTVASGVVGGSDSGWFKNIATEPYGVNLALNTEEGSAWANGEVNPKYTYNVTFKLVFGDGEEFAFPTKAVKMTVKQGSVKFAADVKAVDLDKQSDAVSGTFIINKTDKDAANVADIAKVAVAASKTPSAFEVIETGDGYAIKVVNPTIAKSGSVKLNIWLEGNYEEGCEEIWDTKSPAYRKPNATVSLKVNVK